MAPFKVIARYNEDVSWVTGDHFIVQKGEHIENKGREASSYLWWIVQNYHNLPDYIHFLQGNPFDHCFSDLRNKRKLRTYKIGDPWDKRIDMGKFANKINLQLPETWEFSNGACFVVKKEEILKIPYPKYLFLLKLSMEEYRAAWILERLWWVMFKIEEY